MATASSLEAEAAACRYQALRLDGLIDQYLDPALRLLPRVWVGPAADHLGRELLRYLETVRSVRWELRRKAAQLESEAAVQSASEAAGACLGVATDAV